MPSKCEQVKGSVQDFTHNKSALSKRFIAPIIKFSFESVAVILTYKSQVPHT